jgi:AraC-like DNA-binding protein
MLRIRRGLLADRDSNGVVESHGSRIVQTDLGDVLKSSIRHTSDSQSFRGARVLIRELPFSFQAEHPFGISHYIFGYRPQADERGKAVFTCLDPKYVIIPNHDGPFIAAGARYAIKWEGAEATVVNFHFHPRFVEEIAASLHSNLALLRPLSRLATDEPLESLCRTLTSEVERGCKHGSTFFETLSRALVIAILKGLIPANPVSKLDTRIERAIQYLEQNFRDDVSIDQLAHIAGLSRYHFFRTFHTAVGIPPHEYLIKFRLREARRLIALHGRRRSLGQIAVETGFADQTHFTRRFRQEFGYTPGAWRRGQH